MIGSYGNRWANLAIGEADFLLVLGSRLDIRQTGRRRRRRSEGERTIYHVDCDAGEINNRVRAATAIVADLRAFFAAAASRCSTSVAAAGSGSMARPICTSCGDAGRTSPSSTASRASTRTC